MEKCFAFFDVDETLIRIKSMFAFQEYYYLNHPKNGENLGKYKYQKFLEQMYTWAQHYDRTVVNEKYYETFRGRNKAEVKVMAQKWFTDLKNKDPNLYISSTMEALRVHRQNGTEIVLLSGSSVEILSPLAADLNVQYLLATNLEISGSVFTGKILPPQTIGEGKAVALQRFLSEMKCSGAACHAYGDHISDLYMLESVGFPHVVSGDESLEKIAGERKWNILKRL